MCVEVVWGGRGMAASPSHRLGIRCISCTTKGYGWIVRRVDWGWGGGGSRSGQAVCGEACLPSKRERGVQILLLVIWSCHTACIGSGVVVPHCYPVHYICCPYR